MDFHTVPPLPDEISLLGKVVQRADCKPAFMEEYLRLKRCVVLHTGVRWKRRPCQHQRVISGCFESRVEISSPGLCDRSQVRESPKLARLLLQIENPVPNYKPVASHSHHVRELPLIT